MVKGKQMKEEKFEGAFGGVWGRGPDDVARARKLQLAGKIKESKEVFNKAVEKLEKDKAETKESNFPYNAKYRGYIAEVNALTALVKGTIKEIEGKDATADLKEAAKQYGELGHALDTLAGSCGPYEDIAQIMFESEAEAARKIAEGIKEKFTLNRKLTDAKCNIMGGTVPTDWESIERYDAEHLSSEDKEFNEMIQLGSELDPSDDEPSDD